jgi:cell division protein FtsA
MNNKNFEIYLDYGTSKIRSVAINKKNLENKFFYESDYFYNNLNIENEVEKIISNIEKNTNEYLENINLMIDSPKMESIGLSLSKSLDGSKLKKGDVKFLIQDAKQQILRNYENKNIIHIIIRKYKIDNIEYTFLPRDINCNILSIDTIFICLPKKIIEDLKKVFLKFDVSINQIYCSSYVKSLSYKDNFKFIENICFIDIGFNKTSIIFYSKDTIIFFHVLPVGSNHITKDISKILNLDLQTSEKIKLYFDKNKKIIKDNKLSINLIQKIIFSRIEEILELSIKSIKLNVNLDQSSQFKMILMGDGSRVLDNKFKEKISFLHEIDLLEETLVGICESALKISNSLNKQEVLIVPKKQIKEGFFEKLFHLFK